MDISKISRYYERISFAHCVCVTEVCCFNWCDLKPSKVGDMISHAPDLVPELTFIIGVKRPAFKSSGNYKRWWALWIWPRYRFCCKIGGGKKKQQQQQTSFPMCNCAEVSELELHVNFTLLPIPVTVFSRWSTNILVVSACACIEKGKGTNLLSSEDSITPN